MPGKPTVRLRFNKEESSCNHLVLHQPHTSPTTHPPLTMGGVVLDNGNGMWMQLAHAGVFVLLALFIFVTIVTRGFFVRIRPSKRGFPHWNFSSPRVSVETSPLYKTASAREPGFVRIGNPRMMWLGISWAGAGRKEVFFGAAVAVLTGAYKGLVCETGKSLSGARLLFRPLRTESQRHYKLTRPYTKYLPTATKNSYKIFCLSSKPRSDINNARYTDCDPDSRTIHSIKRRDFEPHVRKKISLNFNTSYTLLYTPKLSTMQILTSVMPLGQDINMPNPGHFEEAFGDFYPFDSAPQENDSGYSYAAEAPLQESPENDFSSDINLTFAFDSFIDSDALVSSSIPSEFTDVRDPLTPQSEFASQPVSPSDDISALNFSDAAPESMSSHLHPQPFGLPNQTELLDYDQRWADPTDEMFVVNMLPSITGAAFPESLFSQPPSYSSSPLSPSSNSSGSSYSPRPTHRSSASRRSSPVQTPLGPTRRRSRVSRASNAARIHICDFEGCDRAFPRPCDLTKHKKRHDKPFKCRFDCLDKRFSTAKDRQRHEHSKHQKSDHLKCCECGHETARKDNMADHVKRKHPGVNLVEAVDTIMSNAASRRASGQGL